MIIIEKSIKDSLLNLSLFKKLPQLMFSLMISKGVSVKTSFIKNFINKTSVI